MKKFLLSLLVLFTIILSMSSAQCCSCSCDNDCTNNTDCQTTECQK